MTLNKSSRFGLYAVVMMAERPEQRISAAMIAEAFAISEDHVAKVLQQLVRARIVAGVRGVGGGYRLARPASQVSVLDVIAIFERPHPPGHCLVAERPSLNCERLPSCGLRQLFDEADELVRCTFASVSLATLARRTAAPRPAPAAAPHQWRGKLKLRPHSR